MKQLKTHLLIRIQLPKESQTFVEKIFESLLRVTLEVIPVVLHILPESLGLRLNDNCGHYHNNCVENYFSIHF